MHFLADPPRCLFFTGRGGGKTSIAGATERPHLKISP
jgi:hypothetical protein